MTANERIAELVNPEYTKRIPSFVRGHAAKATCGVIERDFPEIYEVFNREEEPDADAKSQMSLIVNDIYREHMAKHGL
ncbi:MAG: hypothetical protein SOI26_09430 [Coriobacteriales bacterium]|jgi:hypothetical protein